MNLPLLAGIAFLLFSTCMLVGAIRRLRRATESRSWPIVDGTIDSVRLWGHRNIDGEMREVEHLSIQYRYAVGDQECNASEISMYTVVFPQTIQLARRFSAGGRADVHVDPTAPERAVLVPGPKPEKPCSDLILALIGVLVGVALALSGALGVLE